MKEIPVLKFNEKDTTVTLLRTALDYLPKEGFTLPLIRTRNKVADVIEKLKDGDVIKLEDADFATAQNAIREVRWSHREKYLSQFAEQFSI